jgi:NCAIR mutase (PurE)-related protein
MNGTHLRAILEEVRRGNLDVEEATARLRDLPYQDLGFARLDHHRGLRQGLPEVVFCEGKTTEQVVSIVQSLASHGGPVLATRASEAVFRAVAAVEPAAAYDALGRTILLGDPLAPPPRPGVLVLTAGTADIPVAMEAAVTAEVMGNEVQRIYDVGVAGLHRLLDLREALARAHVIVVVAGMDGALPSVVGGLVNVPVIAVPTSVGYGASYGGLAALLTMLNSCAPGIAVVNIDNGFGAGYVAGLINAAAGEEPGSAGRAGARPGPRAASQPEPEA